MDLYSTYDAAIAAIPPYVPTKNEAAELDKLADRLDFWARKSVWNGDDGFSLSEWLAPAAMNDVTTQMTRILDGRMGAFLVLVSVEDGAIVCTQPSLQNCYGAPWRQELKWIVRENGRMVKDANGRWQVYPFMPARASTLGKYGLAEKWVVAPYRLVDKDETLGEAMKRGTAQPSLVRRVDLSGVPA